MPVLTVRVGRASQYVVHVGARVDPTVDECVRLSLDELAFGEAERGRPHRRPGGSPLGRR